MNDDWIRTINNMIASGEEKTLLSEKIVEVNGQGMTEYDFLKRELQQMSVIHLKERDYIIPNLGDPKVQESILAVIADFKKNTHRAVKPPYLATVDDITVIPLRPEIFGASTFRVNNLTPGTYSLIPVDGTSPGPAGIGTVTNDGFFQIDPTKARIIYTDFVQMGDPIVTAIDSNIDDRYIFPFETRMATEVSDLKVYPLPSIEIQRIKAKIQGKVEFAGNSEMIPVGVAVVLGEFVPTLTQ